MYILYKELGFKQVDIANILNITKQVVSAVIKDLEYRVQIDNVNNDTNSDLQQCLKSNRVKIGLLGYKKLSNDIMEVL